MEIFSLGKSEKYFKLKSFFQYNCLFFRIICSELLRTFTKETFLFEIFFHFSPIKTFPFGLFLMRHISVFQVNEPKSMTFFITSESFALAVMRIYYSRRFLDLVFILFWVVCAVHTHIYTIYTNSNKLNSISSSDIQRMQQYFTMTKKHTQKKNFYFFTEAHIL